MNFSYLILFLILNIFIFTLVKLKVSNYNLGMKNVSREVEIKLIRKVLIHFSAYTNTGEIFNTELNTGTISVIGGLKVLNMCIIILLHSIYFTVDSLGEYILAFST
jgi:hypothetical protein